MKGKLYLIPALLGDIPVEEVIPALNTQIVAGLRHFIVEDERTARRFIKKLVPDADISSLTFYRLDEHSRDDEVLEYLDACSQGLDIGLLSEAGLPCIADPGAIIVRMAHQSGITVIPLTGPSSILLALIASGLNGQRFCFHGYLPVSAGDRARKIKELENQMLSGGQTQIFIETPYRNLALFESLLKTCRSTSLLCVACDISLPSEYIRTYTISEWKSVKPDLHKKPAIFLLGS